MTITIQNVHKRYHDFIALSDVSLTIEEGELMALLGPSGSGKTTLLRMIAGLDVPDSGTIALHGKSGTVAMQDRQVGFVFQHYALFKHMSVFENVAFGLRVRPKEIRPSDAHIHEKVMKLLALVHLDALHARMPNQLSGGQRQRVALARALAVEPKVLLLDEPFGALDAKVRKELRRWMRRLHEELNVTTIFVTHDQEEAMEMADRVVVMSQGKIEQIGAPEDVYFKPTNAFVYDFLGHYNEFAAWQLSDGTLLLQEGDTLRPPHTSSGLLSTHSKAWIEKKLPSVARLIYGLRRVGEAPTTPTEPASENTTLGTAVKVFCRPHELMVAREKQPGSVAATIAHMNPAGPLVKLELERMGGSLLDAELTKMIVDELGLQKGQEVFVRPRNMKVFS
jgi:sulfate/thiosulfate transport system ATP-binding protein